MLILMQRLIFTIIETDQQIAEKYSSFFYNFNLIILFILVLEMLARIIACGGNVGYQGLKGRIRYLLILPNLIDIIIILPFIIGLFFEDLLLLRTVRLLRILVLAKLPSVKKGLGRLAKAAYHIKDELFVSIVA